MKIAKCPDATAMVKAGGTGEAAQMTKKEFLTHSMLLQLLLKKASSDKVDGLGFSIFQLWTY